MSNPAAAPEPPRTTRSRVSGYVVGNWVAIVLVVLAAVFVAQNRERVSVDLFWISITSPLWLILATMFLLGWVAAKLARGRREKRAQQLPPA